jgi:hypothetical protein
MDKTFVNKKISNEKFSLLLGISCFFALIPVALLSYMFYRGPIVGFDFIRYIAGIIFPILAMFIVFTTLIYKKRHTKSVDTRNILPFIPILGIAFAFLFSLISYFAIDLVGQAFRHITPDITSTVLFIAVTSAILAYVLSVELLNLAFGYLQFSVKTPDGGLVHSVLLVWE